MHRDQQDTNYQGDRLLGFRAVHQLSGWVCARGRAFRARAVDPERGSRCRDIDYAYTGSP